MNAGADAQSNILQPHGPYGVSLNSASIEAERCLGDTTRDHLLSTGLPIRLHFPDSPSAPLEHSRWLLSQLRGDERMLSLSEEKDGIVICMENPLQKCPAPQPYKRPIGLLLDSSKGEAEFRRISHSGAWKLLGDVSTMHAIPSACDIVLAEHDEPRRVYLDKLVFNRLRKGPEDRKIQVLDLERFPSDGPARLAEIHTRLDYLARHFNLTFSEATILDKMWRLSETLLSQTNAPLLSHAVLQNIDRHVLPPMRELGFDLAHALPQAEHWLILPLSFFHADHHTLWNLMQGLRIFPGAAKDFLAANTAHLRFTKYDNFDTLMLPSLLDTTLSYVENSLACPDQMSSAIPWVKALRLAEMWLADYGAFDQHFLHARRPLVTAPASVPPPLEEDFVRQFGLTNSELLETLRTSADRFLKVLGRVAQVEPELIPTRWDRRATFRNAQQAIQEIVDVCKYNRKFRDPADKVPAPQVWGATERLSEQTLDYLLNHIPGSSSSLGIARRTPHHLRVWEISVAVEKVLGIVSDAGELYLGLEYDTPSIPLRALAWEFYLEFEERQAFERAQRWLKNHIPISTISSQLSEKPEGVRMVKSFRSIVGILRIIDSPPWGEHKVDKVLVDFACRHAETLADVRRKTENYRLLMDRTDEEVGEEPLDSNWLHNVRMIDLEFRLILERFVELAGLPDSYYTQKKLS